METELASKMSCIFKKLDTGLSPKNKIVSFNFSLAVFSLLDFLTLEDRLSQNVVKELLLYVA